MELKTSVKSAVRGKLQRSQRLSSRGESKSAPWPALLNFRCGGGGLTKPRLRSIKSRILSDDPRQFNFWRHKIVSTTFFGVGQHFLPFWASLEDLWANGPQNRIPRNFLL